MTERKRAADRLREQLGDPPLNGRAQGRHRDTTRAHDEPPEPPEPRLKTTRLSDVKARRCAGCCRT